ncbi:hypothetical protein P1J78_02230 [Psychromarinibacter sp. C21-152]|uniref:DoxX-like family protein n=1 Tax=Psychromarinibacter sediminicola TaxID=3033385 RepID=A0AAE3NKG3_9RHOB|nr:hypothetical protein [Psychromarinibacter sediminicola]MDF0599538.1 hypothetical protein [Psychromarinibacter sediminicola]
MTMTVSQTAAILDRPTRAIAALIRVVTGAFFLATAVTLATSNAGAPLLDGLLPDTAARNATAVYLAITALALTLRLGVRPAALLLAAYVLTTGPLAAAAPGLPGTLEIARIDIVLLFALLAAGLAEPRPLHRALVAPRRVAPGEGADTPRPDAAEAPASPRRNLFADLWDSDSPTA